MICPSCGAHQASPLENDWFQCANLVLARGQQTHCGYRYSEAEGLAAARSSSEAAEVRRAGEQRLKESVASGVATALASAGDGAPSQAMAAMAACAMVLDVEMKWDFDRAQSNYVGEQLGEPVLSETWLTRWDLIDDAVGPIWIDSTDFETEARRVVDPSWAIEIAKEFARSACARRIFPGHSFVSDGAPPFPSRAYDQIQKHALGSEIRGELREGTVAWMIPNGSARPKSYPLGVRAAGVVDQCRVAIDGELSLGPALHEPGRGPIWPNRLTSTGVAFMGYQLGFRNVVPWLRSDVLPTLQTADELGFPFPRGDANVESANTVHRGEVCANYPSSVGVKLENGVTVYAKLGWKLRRKRILLGDVVEVRLDPLDPRRGDVVRWFS